MKENTLINLGWYKKKAIYYDIDKKDYYISSIDREINTSVIIFFVPILSTLINIIINWFGGLIFQNFFIRSSLLFLGCYLMLFSVKFYVNKIRQNTEFEVFRFFASGQERGFLEDCQQHQKLIGRVYLFMLILSLLSGIIYLVFSSFIFLISYSLLLLGVFLLKYEYPNGKRKQLLKKLIDDLD